MKTGMWSACLLLFVTAPAHAQIVKGVMPIKGAEMT